MTQNPDCDFQQSQQTNKITSRLSQNKDDYMNNIYVLNLSKEDVAEFEKRQANIAKLKCTRTGSSLFCKNNNN